MPVVRSWDDPPRPVEKNSAEDLQKKYDRMKKKEEFEMRLIYSFLNTLYRDDDDDYIEEEEIWFTTIYRRLDGTILTLLALWCFMVAMRIIFTEHIIALLPFMGFSLFPFGTIYMVACVDHRNVAYINFQYEHNPVAEANERFALWGMAMMPIVMIIFMSILFHGLKAVPQSVLLSLLSIDILGIVVIHAIASAHLGRKLRGLKRYTWNSRTRCWETHAQNGT